MVVMVLRHAKEYRKLDSFLRTYNINDILLHLYVQGVQ